MNDLFSNKQKRFKISNPYILLVTESNFEFKFGNFVNINVNAFKFYDFALNSSLKNH